MAEVLAKLRLYLDRNTARIDPWSIHDEADFEAGLVTINPRASERSVPAKISTHRLIRGEVCSRYDEWAEIDAALCDATEPVRHDGWVDPRGLSNWVADRYYDYVGSRKRADKLRCEGVGAVAYLGSVPNPCCDSSSDLSRTTDVVGPVLKLNARVLRTIRARRAKRDVAANDRACRRSDEGHLRISQSNRDRLAGNCGTDELCREKVRPI